MLRTFRQLKNYNKLCKSILYALSAQNKKKVLAESGEKLARSVGVASDNFEKVAKGIGGATYILSASGEGVRADAVVTGSGALYTSYFITGSPDSDNFEKAIATI